MTDRTLIHFDERRETPIKVISCPRDFAELATAERQLDARGIFEFPGVLVVDGVFDQSTLGALREGLSDHRRKFKDKFNHGLPISETFRAAHNYAGERMRALTEALFGYALPDKGNRSYRPMITRDEPLHLDTYSVECGKTALMAVLNFDRSARVWNVGPSLREVCRGHADEVRTMVGQLTPGESLNMRLRDAGLRGVGPLRSGTAVNQIEFAPGSVWYSNPKALSHQIVRGGGAQFETWTIAGPACSCPKCTVEQAGMTFAELEQSVVSAALR